MMKNTLILFFVSLCLSSCVQKNQRDSTKAKIDSIQNHKIYIAQTIAFLESFNEKKSILLNEKVDYADFTSCFEQLQYDTLTYTKAELDFILNQRKNPPIKKWTTALIPVAKLINSDTINKIFKDRNKGWNYFYQKIGRYFKSFSAPIFLRNNQYCLFYSSYNCGWLCGEGQLILYKREKNTWKKVKIYCDWIS